MIYTLITVDARLVEHVEQLTRTVDDKHDKALRQVAASAQEFDSKIKHLQDERNHHHEAKIQTIAESIEILHENEKSGTRSLQQDEQFHFRAGCCKNTAKTLAVQLKLSRCAEDEELEADKVYFNTFVHDCQAKVVHWSKMTKNRTEMLLSLDSEDSDLVAVMNLDSQRKKLEPKIVEHKGALNSQLYNAKQLVDNRNKNKVLKQILIHGKDRETGHVG